MKLPIADREPQHVRTCEGCGFVAPTNSDLRRHTRRCEGRPVGTKEQARTEADRVFSLFVRERAGHRCERCFRHEGSIRMHCAHIFRREHTATRCHPDNAACLCALCHDYLTAHPLEHGAWSLEHLGIDRYGELQALSQTITKNTLEHWLDVIDTISELRTELAA